MGFQHIPYEKRAAAARKSGGNIRNRTPEQRQAMTVKAKAARLRNAVKNGRGVAGKRVLRTHCKRGHELTDDNVYRATDKRVSRLTGLPYIYVSRRCTACQRRSAFLLRVKNKGKL